MPRSTPDDLNAIRVRQRMLESLERQTSDVYRYLDRARDEGTLDPYAAVQISALWGRCLDDSLRALGAPAQADLPAPTFIIEK